MSVNKVILVGNLGKDPEMRHTQKGRPVSNFTLATNERWKDKDGQQQERTEWHRIVVWDRLAEVCVEYLGKGRRVYIEGRIQTREWEDKEGAKRYTTEIIATTMQMLGKREGGDGETPAPRPSETYEGGLRQPSDDQKALGDSDEIPF